MKRSCKNCFNPEESDCTPVHVIDDEKWKALEDAFDDWRFAEGDECASAGNRLHHAIKQLMEE